MNAGRKKAFQRIKEKGYGILSYIHPSALVQTDCIGEGCLFFENVTVGPYTDIGCGNIFYPCAHIAHHTSVGNFNFMAVSCTVAGHVCIGNQCFMGNNSTTKDNIVIADRTLIGAGAYVSSDTEYGDVIVPMRSMKLDKKSDEIRS